MTENKWQYVTESMRASWVFFSHSHFFKRHLRLGQHNNSALLLPDVYALTQRSKKLSFSPQNPLQNGFIVVGETRRYPKAKDTIAFKRQVELSHFQVSVNEYDVDEMRSCLNHYYASRYMHACTSIINTSCCYVAMLILCIDRSGWWNCQRCADADWWQSERDVLASPQPSSVCCSVHRDES